MSERKCAECGGLIVKAPLSEEGEFEWVCQSCGLVHGGDM